MWMLTWKNVIEKINHAFQVKFLLRFEILNENCWTILSNKTIFNDYERDWTKTTSEFIVFWNTIKNLRNFSRINKNKKVEINDLMITFSCIPTFTTMTFLHSFVFKILYLKRKTFEMFLRSLKGIKNFLKLKHIFSE